MHRAVAGITAAVTAGVMAASGPSVQLADACEKKIQAVQQRAAVLSAEPRRTSFAEAELNSYLRFKMPEQLPVGLTDPAISLIGRDRVSARAVIDLDVVREKRSSGSWFDPTSYLSGRIPIAAIGAVRTGDGKARFEVERVEVSGVAVPRSLLQQIVAFYTTSDQRPGGASLDDTFEMPAQIRQIDVQAGLAVVIQ